MFSNKIELNLNIKLTLIIQTMIIPIKCFTCGTVLADKYTYYCQRVRQQNPVQRNGQVKKVEYLTRENSEKTIQGRVLDELNLTKMCCRRHMLTHVDIE